MIPYTTEQLLDAIERAVDAEDMPAVAALMAVLAVKDPAAAQTLQLMVNMLRATS